MDEHAGENLPMGVEPSIGTHTITREACMHLSDAEWSAFQRLASIIGERSVAAMLRSQTQDQHLAAIRGFMLNELEKSQQKHTASVGDGARGASVKLSVPPYHGRKNEPLLRWFVELEDSIALRRITDPTVQVMYAMSCLAGSARRWAYGRRLSEPTCFRTYDDFKHDLRGAFEPAQNEFRSRAQFLDLKQGKLSIHEYAEQARYLASNIVSEPLTESTKVVTFMKGLSDGPVKSHLFRVYPKTLREAIDIAFGEDFSLHQAEEYSSTRHHRRSRTDGPEPMDLSTAAVAPRQQSHRQGMRKPKHDRECFVCGRPGHYARECTRGNARALHDRRADGFRQRGQAKNGINQ
jgi:hypothetical protein